MFRVNTAKFFILRLSVSTKIASSCTSKIVKTHIYSHLHCIIVVSLKIFGSIKYYYPVNTYDNPTNICV